MQSYTSHRRGRLFIHLIFFFFSVIILVYWFISITKNIGNYRKYDIFFNFRFTENTIFPPNAENHEHVMFMFSVFTKMLFFMQCNYQNINDASEEYDYFIHDILVAIDKQLNHNLLNEVITVISSLIKILVVRKIDAT